MFQMLEPHARQLSTQLEAEQDMLKLEKARVLELEGQIKQMAAQVKKMLAQARLECYAVGKPKRPLSFLALPPC